MRTKKNVLSKLIFKKKEKTCTTSQGLVKINDKEQNIPFSFNISA